MKKIIALICCLFILQTIHAQVDKATWLVGGNGNFSNENNEASAPNLKITEVHISPNIGYFFIDKLAAGLKLGYTHLKTQVGDSDPSKFNYYNVGPFVRYYFLPSEKIVNPFIEDSYGYEFAKEFNDFESITLIYTIMAGPEIFFNTAVGLEIALGYTLSKYKDISGSNKILFASIGFQFHLKPEKEE